GDEEQRLLVSERAAGEGLVVAARLLAQSVVVLAAAVEFEQEAGRPPAGQQQFAVAVGGGLAVEGGQGAPLAPPLGETAAGLAGFFCEAGEELVHLELMGERLRAAEREGALATPGELGPLELEAGGDDVRAGLVEDPVVGG